MFTGIIEEIGKIQSITQSSIHINATTVLEDIKLGDSIAVNGTCLTVTKLLDGFFADISQETIKITTFKNLKAGDYVNLERALKINERFGGHIVSGHIDGLGEIESIQKKQEFYNVTIKTNPEISKYIINKGSVTVNGISLTVAEIHNNVFSTAIIPHTFEHTNLKYLSIGDSVNIETDILARYVEKFLSTSDNKSRISMNFLKENGFC